jgi:hypothetical protein
MNRFAIRLFAAAVGLFAAGSIQAQEPAQRLGRYVPGEVRTTAATPAPADDTESIFHRRYSRGYAYRPYYGFSFGYSTYFAPRYYAPPVYFYAAPRYYAPPTVYYYSVPSYYSGGFYGVGGTADASRTIPLDLRTGPTGTYRYDGGPSQVVPMPKADDAIQPLAPRPTDDAIKIAYRRATTDEKPRYKAYGEK